MRRQLVEARFEVVREANITGNILRALEVDNDRKLALIHQRVPWLFRKAFKEFAGTPGNATYESFSEARWKYSSFHHEALRNRLFHWRADQGLVLFAQGLGLSLLGY